MPSCQDCIHSKVCLISDNKEYATLQDLKNDCPECAPTADVAPKSEVERLEKAHAAQVLEYDQALQDKARECNMAIDKIYLEHRAELAKAKQEVAREIIDELIEALQGEIDAEERLKSSAWDASDIVGYHIHHYAADKLETLVIAFSLYKKKYTEGNDE